jgi:hypothetical protein
MEELTVKFSALKDLVDNTKEAIASGDLIDTVRAADQASRVAKSLSEFLDKIDAAAWQRGTTMESDK